MAWHGAVWLARCGEVRRGLARRGEVRRGMASFGRVWRGEVWDGMTTTNYQKAIEQAKANLADLMERGEDAIGDDWEDVRKELFTAEEIAESDLRVSLIRKLMGV